MTFNKMPETKKTNGNTRLLVLKTYKLYIGGKFTRTESGRYYSPKNASGKVPANVCRSSRKDFREAVVAARAAADGWASRSAYNRSQIIYRIAEIMEGRKAQFVEEMQRMDYSKAKAETEVNTAIDRLVYYAGWADKYLQIFSSVNPVASSHFNFSLPEPTGVVAGIAAEENALIGLVSVVAPIITGGNVCIILASESKPLCAITFAEALNDSDVPGGVVNILTGLKNELHSHFSSHKDVNAIVYCGNDKALIKSIQTNAATNVKRAIIHSDVNQVSDDAQSPYFIMDTQEIKTTWHPIEDVGSSKAGY